jgi:hypothetical protein
MLREEGGKNKMWKKKLSGPVFRPGFGIPRERGEGAAKRGRYFLLFRMRVECRHGTRWPIEHCQQSTA